MRVGLCSQGTSDRQGGTDSGCAGAVWVGFWGNSFVEKVVLAQRQSPHPQGVYPCMWHLAFALWWPWPCWTR